MATVDPAEYGATYPTHLELVTEFVPAATAPNADPLVVCDEGIRLFGLAVGEAVVHSVAPLNGANPA